MHCFGFNLLGLRLPLKCLMQSFIGKNLLDIYTAFENNLEVMHTFVL